MAGGSQRQAMLLQAKKLREARRRTGRPESARGFSAGGVYCTGDIAGHRGKQVREGFPHTTQRRDAGHGDQAAIRPYSMAVAPDSSWAKYLKWTIMKEISIARKFQNIEL
jgi:hypothetical protein